MTSYSSRALRRSLLGAALGGITAAYTSLVVLDVIRFGLYLALTLIGKVLVLVLAIPRALLGLVWGLLLILVGGVRDMARGFRQL